MTNRRGRACGAASTADRSEVGTLDAATPAPSVARKSLRLIRGIYRLLLERIAAWAARRGE
jgi:hypothetical protein